MTERTLIPFPGGAVAHRSTRSAGTAARSIGTRAEPDLRLRQSSVDVASAASQVPIDTLYPESQGDDIGKALELLADGVDIFEKARNASDIIGSDRQVLRFQVLLPKLFSCRSIGEGFAVVVNSLHFAFVNLHGKPLSEGQIMTIWRVLKATRLRPFIAFDQAMELVIDLEKSGLEIDPAAMPELLEEEEDE
jgi:hypothetical protein